MKLINRLSLLNTTFIFFALVMMVFSSVQAHAGDKGEFFLKKTAKELNLTAEQKEKFKSIHASNKEEMRAKRKAMKAAHEDLEKALQGTATDEEIKTKFGALHKLQEEFAQARFEKVLAVRAILTPEQRAKMRVMPEGHGMHDKWKKKKDKKKRRD